MNPQFKRGIVELCVLSEISRTDMYGFEVIHSISKSINVNENTIYPILRRLTKDEYFTTYLQESPTGAPRKYYKITELGLTHYHELKKQFVDFLDGVNEILEKGQKIMKEKFLNDLAKELSILDFSNLEIDEIISDYDEIIENGREDGLDDEKIFNMIGKPKDIAIELKEDLGETDTKTYEQFPNNNLEKKYEVNDNLKLSTILIDEDLTIKTHNEDFLLVEGEKLNPKQKYNIEFKNNHLIIERKKGIKFNLFKSNKASFTIFIPDNFIVDNAKINMISGDIDIKVPSINKLNIKTISGDISGDDIKIDDTQINTVSGDIVINNFSGTILELVTVSGDLQSNLFNAEKLSIKTVSGDAVISDGNINSLHFKSVSGDGVFKSFDVTEATISTVNGDVLFDRLDKNKEIQFLSKKTLSGKIKVQ